MLSSIAKIMCILSSANIVEGFTSTSYHPRPQTLFATKHRSATGGTYKQQHMAIPKHSPLEDEPWNDDNDSYWDALQVASKDPATFEKFIEESIARKKQGEKISSSAMGLHDTSVSAVENAPKKKSKYVPIEEWDASRTVDDMSSEERLQWECQRSGNQYRQNEILMNNIKGF